MLRRGYDILLQVRNAVHAIFYDLNHSEWND